MKGGFSVYDMRDIGNACRRYRKYIGYTQSEVAAELGFTGKAISGFECGRSYNALILLWYVYQGIDLREVVGNGTNTIHARPKYKRLVKNQAGGVSGFTYGTSTGDYKQISVGRK